MRWLLSILLVSALGQDSQQEASRHLDLAATWLTQYIPGSEAPGNLELGRRAESELIEVLRLEPNNKTALFSLASLNELEAHGIPDLDQKLRKFDEAASWYEKVLAVDPQDKNAYYSLGVIAWKEWYPNWLRVREQLHMKPDDSGPLPDSSARRELVERYGSLIERGISNLERALQIDPMYDDAMAYMNLMYRERADLECTDLSAREQDLKTADEWIDKVMAARKANAKKADGPK